MLEFGRKVMRVGTEIEGSVSFELSEENADLEEKAAAHEQICVVVDQVLERDGFRRSLFC